MTDAYRSSHYVIGPAVERPEEALRWVACSDQGLRTSEHAVRLSAGGDHSYLKSSVEQSI